MQQLPRGHVITPFEGGNTCSGPLIVQQTPRVPAVAPDLSRTRCRGLPFDLDFAFIRKPQWLTALKTPHNSNSNTDKVEFEPNRISTPLELSLLNVQIMLSSDADAAEKTQRWSFAGFELVKRCTDNFRCLY
ncbi:unnamed protein product, partial [Iphiclides podalirius]